MANNASRRGTRNPLYDGDNEESTGSNHQLNPTAPANQQLSNEAVSRQLAEIARMLAQWTSQVAIGNTLAAPAAQGTNPPSTTPDQGTEIHNHKANQEYMKIPEAKENPVMTRLPISPKTWHVPSHQKCQEQKTSL